MSLSESEKHGIKLLGQSCDGLSCMPPKKRHLLWPQPSVSISSSPATNPPNACHQIDKDSYAQDPGFSDPGAEADSVSETVLRTVPDKTANVKSSPGHDKRDLVAAFCVAGTEADPNGKLQAEDTSQDSKPIAEKSELSAAHKNPYDLITKNEAGAELPNYEVQQAENHEIKPSKQLLRPSTMENCSGSASAANKQETLTPGSDGAAFDEVILNDGNSSENVGFGEMCSDRSNWDLNTVMDSWGRFFPDADRKESPAREPAFEDTGNGGFDVDNNHASALCDNFHSEPSIELKLNSTIDSLTKVGQISPNHLSRPNSLGDATRLNLSMSFTRTAHSTQSINSAVNDKSFDQGLVEKMNSGKQNVDHVMLKNVKNEPSEVPIVGAKIDVPNDINLADFATVKPENQIESFQNISGKIWEKVQFSESHLHSLDFPRCKHTSNEKNKSSQHMVPQISVGEPKCVNSFLSKVPTEGVLQPDFLQASGFRISMNSISRVKLELPEGSKLGANVVVTDTGCSRTGEVLVNSGIALDSKHTHGTNAIGMQPESSERAKFALVSESPGDVQNDNSEHAAAQSSPHKLFNPNIIDRVSDYVLEKSEEVSDYVLEKSAEVSDYVLEKSCEVPKADGLVAVQSSGDKEHIESCGNKMRMDTKNGKLLSQLSYVNPCITESLSCPRDLVPPQVNSRQHIDDNDSGRGSNDGGGDGVIDGIGDEVTDPQQLDIEISLGDSKIKCVCNDEAITSFVSIPGTAPTLNETGRVKEFQNLMEAQNSTLSDFSVKMDSKTVLSDIVSDQGPRTPKLPPAREPCKKKHVKSVVVDKVLKDSGQNVLPSKCSNECHGFPIKKAAVEVDSYKMKLEGSLLFPSNSKAEVMPKPDGTVHIPKTDTQNRVFLLNSTSKDLSSERRKASDRKWISPKTAKERSCDQLKGDGPHRGVNRDESCSSGPKKVENEQKKNETSRKVGSEYMLRGRTKRTLHNDQNSDVNCASEHFNNADSYCFTRHKNVPEMISAVSRDRVTENTGRVIRSLPVDAMDNFSRIPFQRRSPGGRYRAFGRMVRRRGTSPRRCIDAPGPDAVLLNREENFIPNLRENMVDASTFAGPCTNFERSGNSFMRRSLSPIQRRRGLPILPRMCSPSRRRPHSPCQLSPQRSSGDFDGHPEGVPSMALRLDRIRSPRRHDLFVEDMVVRRHASPPPYMPRLHDGLRNDNPPRPFNFARSRRPFQPDTRNFHFINGEADGEVEYFGPPLNPGPIRELSAEENVDDGRNCSERHGLVRPFRHYNIAGNPGDEDFSFRIERNPPPSRPVRFHEAKEGFPERDDLHGGIRHHTGEMPRGMRTMEERGVVCQRDGSQGWSDSNFGDVRLKRRRY